MKKKLIAIAVFITTIFATSGLVSGEDIGLQAQESGAMWRLMDLAPANGDDDIQDNPVMIMDGNCYMLTYKLDTIQVPANKDTSTYSAIDLEAGKTYTLRVSGTAFAGDYIEFDAKYSFRTVSSTEWTDSVSTYEYYGSGLLDLKVNGEFVDWGEYTPTHVYSTTVTGDGSPLELLIYDIYYPNNSGELTVEIYPHE